MYDFRCDDCGAHFELTRSFSQSSEPAVCPRDGADAARLFSPPMDLLVYNREPLVSTGRVTIPPGALACHDHGPPPGAHDEEHEGSGSSWHARLCRFRAEPARAWAQSRSYTLTRARAFSQPRPLALICPSQSPWVDGV